MHEFTKPLIPRKREFPIGTSSFAGLVRRENGEFVNNFVDKTLFIQQLLQSRNIKILLFPRFRRSAKSMNLDMTKCFFDIVGAETNRQLFQGLKIQGAQLDNNVPCMSFQGQFPVILIDFKKLCQNSNDEMYEQFKMLIYEVYKQHRYLLDSPNLKDDQKNMIKAIINQTAPDVVYKNALKYLMEFLYLHYDRRKVIVLIDGYDAPFQQAIQKELYGQEKEGDSYLTKLRNLFSVFLGDALKGNDVYLEKCVMTGIVRIAGTGVFSQLNNLTVYTIFDKPFSNCFGFTKSEVEQLVLGAFGDNQRTREFLVALEEWYNGYRFGDEIIFNPWSVMRACDDFSKENIRDIHHLNCYWLDTSNNELIRSMLLNCRSREEERQVNELIATLVSGQRAQRTLNPGLIYDSRIESIEHLWVLLLSTGYLNVVAMERTADEQLKCQLVIPNREVRVIYTQIFRDWARQNGIKSDSPLIKHLLEGNAEAFCKELETLFKNVVSVRDTVEKKPGRKVSKDEKEDESYEAYYHGFMVGILGLSLNADHHKVMLTSNRESGYGFYDLLLEPKNPADPVYNKAVIFEFKRCIEEKDLEKEAKAALKQIKEREYEAPLHMRGVKTIVLIGVAFYKKRLKYKCDEVSTASLTYKAGVGTSPAQLTHSLGVAPPRPTAALLKSAATPIGSATMLLAPASPPSVVVPSLPAPLSSTPSAAVPSPMIITPTVLPSVAPPPPAAVKLKPILAKQQPLSRFWSGLPKKSKPDPLSSQSAHTSEEGGSDSERSNDDGEELKHKPPQKTGGGTGTG